MSKISVGATVNIQFNFIYDDNFVDPDTITGEIYKDDVFQENFAPSLVTQGVYNYSWLTNASGSFELRLTGEFNDSTPDLVHRKYFLIGETESPETLDSSYVVTMLGVLSPLYVDPEYILQYYSSGDLTEITEIIYRKSLELESYLGCTGLTSVTSPQHDFIVAATMCELSRIYGLNNGGLTGFSSTDSFELGDLKVDKGSSNIGSGGQYDSGNAQTWCELASYLKSQLSTAGGTFRSVVPGVLSIIKVPSRELKSSDY